MFPLIGALAVNNVTPPILLDALRRIESRDAPSAAKKMRQTCGQIFRYAIATGRAEYDPAAGLKDALTPKAVRNFASIKEPKAIGALLRNIGGYTGNEVVRSALRIAPYLFVRPGELRRAEWEEFTLGGDAPEWRIPAEKMKMKAQHIVPLSHQVVKILQELQPFTGHTRYLFPSMRASVTPDMALRLSRAFSSTPELWLNLQQAYDLWVAENEHTDW